MDLWASPVKGEVLVDSRSRCLVQRLPGGGGRWYSLRFFAIAWLCAGLKLLDESSKSTLKSFVGSCWRSFVSFSTWLMDRQETIIPQNNRYFLVYCAASYSAAKKCCSRWRAPKLDAKPTRCKGKPEDFTKAVELMEDYKLDCEDSIHLAVATAIAAQEILPNDKDFDAAPIKSGL